MTFSADVRKFTDKAEQAADRTIRAITFALFREVVRRTPVDTGHLKGNWQTTRMTPAVGQVPTLDPSGSATIAMIARNMGGMGGVTYLTNNLPYAHRIEYDGWSHTKAPEGMVRVSLARIDRIVKSATSQNKV